MVGIGTVLADNPELTVRDADGSDPLRVIIDSCLKTPPDARILADSNVIIATTNAAGTARLAFFKEHGVEVWTIEAKDGNHSIFTELDSYDFTKRGLEIHNKKIPYIRFDAAAQEIFYNFSVELNKKINKNFITLVARL